MALFLETIPSPITNTLSLREKKATDRSQYGWFYDRMAWVRVTSMAEVNGDANLRKKWVLFAGTQKDGKIAQGIELYKKNNRPVPGLKTVNIQNKGTAGSLREATFEYICWDLEQLNVLENLYMTFGISVLVEWGWNKKINGDHITENFSIQEPMFDYIASQKFIKAVQDNGGHYDAMQGIITNFDWSLRDDGGFDCNTTIVSLGESFLTQDIHSRSKRLKTQGAKEDNEVSGIEENIEATIYHTAETIKNDDVITVDGKIYGGKIDFDYDKPDEEETDNSAFGKLKGDNNNFFVSWGFIERFIINNNLAVIVEKQKGMDATNTPKNTISAGGQTLNLFAVIDSTEAKLNYVINLISCDPYVCILPQVLLTIPLNQDKYNETYPLPNGYSVNPIDQTQKIDLKDILVNLKFVHSTYQSTDDLNSFVKEMLNGISEACGGIWKFQLIVNEDEPTVINIKEENTVEHQNKISPFKFQVYKKNSIVRKVSLNTQVDAKMKSMIVYGVNKKRNGVDGETEMGNEGTSEYNFFGSNVKNLAGSDFVPIQANQMAEVDPIDVTTWSQKDQTYWSTIMDALNAAVEELFKKRTPDSVSNAKKSMLSYITEITKEGEGGKVQSHKTYPTLPIALKVEIDGIGGIKYGHLIDIDYKPERYGDEVAFQVTNVSHTISDGDWTTELTTIMRVITNSYIDSQSGTGGVPPGDDQY